MSQSIIDIVPSGLDTLSERALLRLTDRFTGDLLPADSLPASSDEAVMPQVAEAIVESWREQRNPFTAADLSEVLGESATLADGVQMQPTGEGLVAHLAEGVVTVAESGASDTYYNILVLLLSFLYIFCMYRYFDDIVALFSSSFHRRFISTDRSEERRHTDIFYGSLGKLFMLGTSFVGLLMAFVVLRGAENYSMKLSLLMPFIAMAIFALVIVVQSLILAVVGIVVRSTAEVAALQRIRLIYFVLMTLLVAPSLLISLMTTGDVARIWFYVGAATMIVAIILFIRESIEFFISKKVSILHWFLYLCTVEIVPFTLLWQAAIRVGS